MVGKPMKGQWIVKLEKLRQCNKCSSYVLDHTTYKKHIQDVLDERDPLQLVTEDCVDGINDNEELSILGI